MKLALRLLRIRFLRQAIKRPAPRLGKLDLSVFDTTNFCLLRLFTMIAQEHGAMISDLWSMTVPMHIWKCSVNFYPLEYSTTKYV